jgi:hypothetical protein
LLSFAAKVVGLKMAQVAKKPQGFLAHLLFLG